MMARREVKMTRMRSNEEGDSCVLATKLSKGYGEGGNSSGKERL